MIAGAWKDPGQIHELEARTEMLGLKGAGRDPVQHGSLLLPTGDNLSAVCAFEKGRATSLELLAHCRRSAAVQISCEMRWWQRHVISEKNFADRMSRAADRRSFGEARLHAELEAPSCRSFWRGGHLQSHRRRQPPIWQQ